MTDRSVTFGRAASCTPQKKLFDDDAKKLFLAGAKQELACL
jgi:hypothetical protein